MHYALPFSFQDGAIATSDDDSAQEITDCATNVLRTEEGSLEWLPGFGRPDWAFQSGGVDPAEVHELILQWEDRATPEVTAQAISRLTVTEEVQSG